MENLNEIEQIDIKTSKILSMMGSFHQNSDIECLYIKLKNGGRELKCIKTPYEARIAAARCHLLSQKKENEYFACVINLEENKFGKSWKRSSWKWEYS